MSSQVISSDDTTVVIQINPQVIQEIVEGQDKRGTNQNPVLKGFLKIQPKSLGSVQILTGVMILLFGIVLTSTDHPGNTTVYSGITYWGSLIFISAGSLSVAAENKLHSCVVNASLGMNVLSAITAGIAIFLMSVHIANRYYSHYSVDKGIVGILMVFSFLQFIISICISAFACKATCKKDPTVVNVLLNQIFREGNFSTKQTTTKKAKLAERKENT